MDPNATWKLLAEAFEQVQSDADFELEKLRRLGDLEMDTSTIKIYFGAGYRLGLPGKNWLSENVIGYNTVHFREDTESNRLLKRAEFLRAVCEKEGVEWLLEENSCDGCMQEALSDIWQCPRHGEEGCGCGCHHTGNPGCMGCSKDCPDRVLRYGPVGGPDFYTKQEVDERLQGIADILDRLVAGKSNWVQNQKAIADFRSRFLP